MDNIEETLILFDSFLTKDSVQEMVFFAIPQENEVPFPTLAPTIIEVDIMESGLKIPMSLSSSTIETLSAVEYLSDDRNIYFSDEVFGSLIRIKLRLTSSEENSSFRDLSLRILNGYTQTRETTILSGLNLERQYPGYLLRIKTGMISYEGDLFSCADTIKDLREDLASIPPRGVGVLVLYIDKNSIDSAGTDKIITDIQEVFLPVVEWGDIDPIIEQAHKLMEENAGEEFPLIEIGKVLIIDNLTHPPTVKIIYNQAVRVDGLANWQI